MLMYVSEVWSIVLSGEPKSFYNRPFNHMKFLILISKLKN